MTGPARLPGMDNEYYDFSAMASPPRPCNGRTAAHVALCVIVNLEHYEWDLSKIKTKPQSMPGFRAPLPLPGHAQLLPA